MLILFGCQKILDYPENVHTMKVCLVCVHVCIVHFSV